jgi:hypothetical protein
MWICFVTPSPQMQHAARSSFRVETDAIEALAAVLPPVESQDFYRITLTGYGNGKPIMISAAYPHLELRDETVPETDLWGTAGEDTLEGIYFGMLKAAMDGQNDDEQRRIRLAARISRQILDGQEVKLP